MKKIKYCCRNLKNGAKPAYKSLKAEFPDIKHKKRDCLGCCRLCSKQCVVMIGKKETLCAATPELLYKQLKERIG